MLRPRLPDVPTLPTAAVTPQRTEAPAFSAGRAVAPYVGVGVGAVAAVAVAAVVLRSLLSSAHKR
ncbi:SpdD protein [Streptomyces sp. SAS_269]|uniref:SpdD protein n=1 Tax=Streptomyces sp. SAS_269 TaxID=3412749 RepID=UPI00403C6751